MIGEIDQQELAARCRRAERSACVSGTREARALVGEYIAAAWEFYDLGNDAAADMFSREALKAAHCPETAVA
jgi:hypothetical protein